MDAERDDEGDRRIGASSPGRGPGGGRQAVRPLKAVMLRSDGEARFAREEDSGEEAALADVTAPRQ